jgi:hypothetical protein
MQARQKRQVRRKRRPLFTPLRTTAEWLPIWDDEGRILVGTIDPRSVEGKHLLQTPESSEAAAG